MNIIASNMSISTHDTSNQLGFMLIEMLASLFILSLLCLLSYQTIQHQIRMSYELGIRTDSSFAIRNLLAIGNHKIGNISYKLQNETQAELKETCKFSDDTKISMSCEIGYSTEFYATHQAISINSIYGK